LKKKKKKNHSWTKPQIFGCGLTGGNCPGAAEKAAEQKNLMGRENRGPNEGLGSQTE